MIRLLKDLIKKIVFKFIRPPVTIIDKPVTSINNSNSQAGEDKIVSYLFGSMGINKITYIDIGTNDPIGCNNTYLFYNNGNRGVLVEPDPNFNRKISEARPEDILINAGISYSEGDEIDFYIFNEPSLNTLSKDEAYIRQSSGVYKIVETKKIKLLTIENIIKNYLNKEIPDLISIDVEGVDYAVLKSFDFITYPVPIWIVETCGYSENHIKPKVKNIIDLMLTRGYFVFADTYINTIFVHEKWYNEYNYEL